MDWESLKAELENRKLSPAQRRRLKLSKMNTQMKAYWSKAVGWVNDGKTHPNRIINQPFTHGRMAMFHEVGFCVLCVFNSFNTLIYVFVCVRICRSFSRSSVIAVMRNGGLRRNTWRTTVGNGFAEGVSTLSIPWKLRYFRKPTTWLVVGST